MKLVEILAKEMSKWPSGFNDVGQAFAGELHLPGIGEHVRHTKEKYTRSEDWGTAIVTHAQWQAERDRQKGGEWKRHRGNSQPVDEGTWVEVKLRCGDIQQGLANAFLWRHADCDVAANIMQYRVIIQPQAEEPTANVFTGKDAGVEYAFGEPGCDMSKLDWKPLGNAKTGDIEFYSVKAGEAEVNKFCMGKNCNATSKNILHSSECEAEHEASYTGAWAQSSGPLAWRDTIIHCQAIIEDCEREIERNVELLDAEGLMIQTNTKTAMQHYETAVDMSDWRNWKEGDIVEVVIDNDSDLPIGKQYPVSQIEKPGYKGGMPVMIKDEDDCEYWPEDSKYDLRPVFKFVRRP